MKRLIARISGKVQRAGYRGKVVTIAKAFGLRGYVQNLSDGRVKVVAEGDDADLERFAGALVMKNSIIYVTNVETEYTKQDQMLDKQDQMLDKQDQMLIKQDQVLEKMDRMEINIVNKLDEVQEGIVGEIKDLRSDMKPHLDDRLLRIETDVNQIKARMGL
ncbi:MAG: acylphosphatase [Methanotrichaceae archaeon]